MIKLENLIKKLREDQNLVEFSKRVDKIYTYFSSGFSLGHRALFSKSQDFTAMGDPKKNLWVNEFRMFDILRKYPRYILKEYVFQVVMLSKKAQQLENKIVQLTRKVKTLSSKLINKDAPAAAHGALKSFELHLIQLLDMNRKDILELVDEDYQEVVNRVFSEDKAASICSLSKTLRFNKFFELYVFKIKKSIALSEFYIKGNIIVENIVKKALAVIDVL